MEGYLLIIGTLVTLILLFIVIRLIAKPVKIVTKILINCFVAILVLFGINFIGIFVGLHLPINLVTVLTVGVLGFPGLGLVAVLNYLLI